MWTEAQGILLVHWPRSQPEDTQFDCSPSLGHSDSRSGCKGPSWPGMACWGALVPTGTMLLMMGEAAEGLGIMPFAYCAWCRAWLCPCHIRSE